MSVPTTQLFFAHFSVEKRVQIILIWLGFAFIAFAVILILNRVCRGRQRSLKRVSLLALRTLYAKGEINQAEYERELRRRGHQEEP